MIISKYHTFHSAATTAVDGNIMDVAGLNALSIQISGTSTAREILFKASIDTENFVDLMGMDMSTLAPSTSTTSTAKIFTFDVRGMSKVYLPIDSISGGNVTIKGLAIK